MAKRIAITSLNASTMDILNTIRANATAEYQGLVPEVEKETDLPKVGEVLYGYPAMANLFINALVNRIAIVRVKSATFNNAYANLKKGFLEFGETVEEVFVNIAKAREFSPEKAQAREFKRTIPDVRTAFHTMNWRVQYPVTIQNEDLRQAFTSFNGVEDLIAKIVDSVTTASEYDEYLLFKYLIIKAVSHGKMYPVAFDATNIKNAAVQFRGTSNDMEFLKTKYNNVGVHTNTKKADQVIFMDSYFNAQYDVDVLASAFNMGKAEFMGRLYLIDDFTTFDNERFDVIRDGSTMIEEVTAEELALMADVKAVLLDEEWFQIYDNLAQFSEQYVGSGLYWNYFYNVWKTVSYSPFSNAVVFVAEGANIAMPASLTVEVTDKSISEVATILTLGVGENETSLAPSAYNFVQTQSATENGVGVHKYGAIMYPATAGAVTLDIVVNGVTYRGATTVSPDAEVGSTIAFNKVQ